MKLCKDCKHFLKPSYEFIAPLCLAIVDVIQGKPITAGQARTISDMRDAPLNSARCGPAANLWEQK